MSTITDTAQGHYHGETAMGARMAVVEAMLGITPPVITPVYTPVPPNGLVAALNAAADGATLYLDGTYPIAGIGYYGGRNLHILPVPGKTATVTAPDHSTLLYADSRYAKNADGTPRPAVNILWDHVAFVGADVLQGDSNGSSNVGNGPGADTVVFQDCSFSGSAAWTGNTQHLAYFFGAAGLPAPKNCKFIRCIFDGKGMKAEMVSFYHSDAADGALIQSCTLKNAFRGIQLYDHPANGIVIDDCDFDAIGNVPVNGNYGQGVRHYYSTGTRLTNSRFRKSVTTPWLADGDAANFSQSGNTTGI
jgi:hypothetical protein